MAFTVNIVTLMSTPANHIDMTDIIQIIPVRICWKRKSYVLYVLENYPMRVLSYLMENIRQEGQGSFLFSCKQMGTE